MIGGGGLRGQTNIYSLQGGFNGPKCYPFKSAPILVKILLNIVKKLAMSVHFMANVPGQPDLERHLCRSELKVFVGLGTHMAETLPLTIPEGPNSPLSQPMLARKLAEIPGMQEQIRELCNRSREEKLEGNEFRNGFEFGGDQLAKLVLPPL